jgi:anti-sigma factor RsiW
MWISMVFPGKFTGRRRVQRDMSLAGHIEHLRLRRLLDAAIDGELPPDLGWRVDRHIGSCPVCTRDAATTAIVKRRLPFLRQPGA